MQEQESWNTNWEENSDGFSENLNTGLIHRYKEEEHKTLCKPQGFKENGDFEVQSKEEVQAIIRQKGLRALCTRCFGVKRQPNRNRVLIR